MYQVGQKLTNKMGIAVEILAILPEDKAITGNGDRIVALVGDTYRHTSTYSIDGRFRVGEDSDMDLEGCRPLIQTTFVNPPIPTRSFDWRAQWGDAGDESQGFGWGTTEANAIADLKDNYPREQQAEAA